MALVIVGYWFSTITQGASLSAMLALKIAILGLSLVITFFKCQKISIFKKFKNEGSSKAFLVLAVFATLPNIFSGAGFYKTLTLILPLYYIILSVAYLIQKFGLAEFLKFITLSFLLVYSIPLFSYLIYGGGFAVTNIYGYSEETNGAFVSNHYGWSSVLVITSIFIYGRLVRLSLLLKIVSAVVLLLAFYFLFISGSRSGLVSLSLISMLIILKKNMMAFGYKVSLIFVTVLFTVNLLEKQDSALNYIVEKTRSQIEGNVDSRAVRTERLLAYFGENPILWLTGIGLFNQVELDKRIGYNGYHNSYWDVLFGGGVILFLFFLRFAIWHQIKVVLLSRHPFILFFPIFLIIPFFEFNLTSGQFLFFPWFIVITTLAHRAFRTKAKSWQYKPSYQPYIQLSNAE